MVNKEMQDLTVKKLIGLVPVRMLTGNEFHAAGPACEKARSPNFVRSRVLCCRDCLSMMTIYSGHKKT